MNNRKLTLAIIISAITGAVIISCKTQFATTKDTYTATVSDARFERGKVLTYSICGGCHYDRVTNKFIGAPIHDIPGIAGKVVSANLTHSKTGVTDHYTDAEIRYLLKTGVARNGRLISQMKI
jgi:hypothetical protein